MSANKGPRQPLTLRMPRSLRNRLAKQAAEEGMSLNDWMCRAIEKRLDHLDQVEARVKRLPDERPRAPR